MSGLPLAASFVNASDATEPQCAPSEHIRARPALSSGRAVTDSTRGAKS
jgi:hypothetical protein